MVHSGARGRTGCAKCTFPPTSLSVKLESWNLVWMLEFGNHKLSYTSYFEKNRCEEVHSDAQWCTGCRFSLSFLSVKLESWNLVRRLEARKHYKINDFLLLFLSIVKVLLIESSKFSGLIVRNWNIFPIVRDEMSEQVRASCYWLNFKEIRNSFFVKTCEKNGNLILRRHFWCFE